MCKMAEPMTDSGTDDRHDVDGTDDRHTEWYAKMVEPMTEPMTDSGTDDRDGGTDDRQWNR